MSPDEEFNALLELARAIDSDELPLKNMEDYALTITATKEFGGSVRVRLISGTKKAPAEAGA
jgi:hypothetical protein